MNRPNRPVALLLLVAVAAAWSCDRSGDGEAAGADLEPIREAPPFALETLDGDTLRSSDLADREAILMNFWASWCLPCRAEVPDLIALHEDLEDEGFTVLGVTVNDLPRDSRAFVEETGMTYPSVIGTPAMLEEYRLSPWLPTTLLVVDGRVVREWVGPRTRREFEGAVRAALGMGPPLDRVPESRPAEEPITEPTTEGGA